MSKQVKFETHKAGRQVTLVINFKVQVNAGDDVEWHNPTNDPLLLFFPNNHVFDATTFRKGRDAQARPLPAAATPADYVVFAGGFIAKIPSGSVGNPGVFSATAPAPESATYPYVVYIPDTESFAQGRSEPEVEVP